MGFSDIFKKKVQQTHSPALELASKVSHKRICLFHEGNQYQGTHIELRFENNGEIVVMNTGWWPAHRGASNGGQVTTKLDTDYFITHSIDDFIEFLTNICKMDFSHLKNRQDIIFLFQAPVFKMKTKDGQIRNFVYSGHTRYNPNRSSTCGYGSDDWFFLCKESDKHYLLMFQDHAEFGTGWRCTELLEGDYEKLVKEEVDFWGNIAYSKERTNLYAIRLTDVESVRQLLPTCSRCGKLTDESYLR